MCDWNGRKIEKYTGKIDGGAQRFNEGKLRMELVPTSTMRSLARVMGYGANKYAPNNWKRGMDWSKVIGCLYRHLTAWQDGEDFDSESKLNHMDHVAANVAFLLEYIENFPQGDDRSIVKLNNKQIEKVQNKDKNTTNTSGIISTLKPKEGQELIYDKLYCTKCDNRNIDKDKLSFNERMEIPGCGYCGGFGYLATRINCPVCIKELWHKPDPITVYNGKVHTTFCGNKIVYIHDDIDSTWECIDCYNKKLDKA